eukprot:3548140-Heterocapsa_arctica.AAC.1
MDAAPKRLASRTCGEQAQKQGTRLLEEDICASGTGLTLEPPGIARLCHYHDQTYAAERLVGKCEYLTCYHQGTMAWEGIKLCARHVKPTSHQQPRRSNDHQ